MPSFEGTSLGWKPLHLTDEDDALPPELAEVSDAAFQYAFDIALAFPAFTAEDHILGTGLDALRTSADIPAPFGSFQTPDGSLIFTRQLGRSTVLSTAVITTSDGDFIASRTIHYDAWAVLSDYIPFEFQCDLYVYDLRRLEARAVPAEATNILDIWQAYYEDNFTCSHRS